VQTHAATPSAQGRLGTVGEWVSALLAGKASTAVGEHERLLTATLECGMPGMQCLAHLFAAQALQTAGTPGAAVHLAQASTIAQEMGSRC
jgi:hypothetical protein